MGIINMNGRIYDPLIGRFMSADPYIQAPDDLQSHNRYAYVMNNPLNLDDPSGYFSISRAWKRVWKNPIFKAVLGIAVAFYAPQLLQSFFPTLFGASTLATTVATGALSGFASTGTLKGALTGAFTAGIMFGVGEIGQALKLESGGLGKIALHAGAGCASSVAGGGSCKTGAISGALGEVGNLLPTSNVALSTVKAAMLGGIGSKLAGGKFEDGARTWAFGYLFNELLHASGGKAASGYETKKTNLSYSDAVEQWATGGGMDVCVPLSSLDLSSVSTADFAGVGHTKAFNLSGNATTNLSDQLTFGNVTLTLVSPGVVSAGYDQYNFDLKPLTLDTLPRNVATFIGGQVNDLVSNTKNLLAGKLFAGKGQSFFIQLDGQAKIR